MADVPYASLRYERYTIERKVNATIRMNKQGLLRSVDCGSDTGNFSDDWVGLVDHGIAICVHRGL